MKIGFIEPGVHLCGGIRRIIETSNRLLKLGHSVNIFTPKGKPCTWIPNKVPILKWDHLKNFSHDILVFNLAENYRIVLEHKAKLKVFWCLAPEANYKNPTIPIRALQQDEFRFMANSRYVVDYIKKHRPNYKHPIPITPAGINKKQFYHDPQIPTQYHVLYYGSKRPWKGTQIIETALGGIPKIKALKMEGLNTPQHEMYKLYNQCDIFVSAAQCEGFNMPILEAMACGTAVVCTDDGGSRDFVRHQKNAIVVKRYPNNIKNAILALMREKELRKRLRFQGFQTASKPCYSWDNVVKTFLNSCNSMIR